MKIRDVIQMVEADGCYFIVQKVASPYKHPVKKGRVTIAGHPSMELHPKTLASILRQGGLKIRIGLMSRYIVVIEKGESNYSAYVPDLPGCVAAAETIEETEKLIGEAIAVHIQGMREDGLEIPAPTSILKEVEVP